MHGNFWSNAARLGFKIPVFDSKSSASEAFFPNSQCRILDGKGVADALIDQCRTLSLGRTVPRLEVILVGEDPASQVYVASKTKAFERAGFRAGTTRLAATETTAGALRDLIRRFNADPSVHGILVQLPLPHGIDASSILNEIAPAKDVDGFLPQNMGALLAGQNTGAIACTPFGVMVLLAAYRISLAGRHAVVVGRSNIVGKPMSILLLGEDCTVTIGHSKTHNLVELCRQADILVAAAGRPCLITSDHVKPGAVVVDVGIHRKADGKLCGDVDPAVVALAGYLSPVPRGVGPMTIAQLCVNTALAAWRHL